MATCPHGSLPAWPLAAWLPARKVARPHGRLSAWLPARMASPYAQPNSNPALVLAHVLHPTRPSHGPEHMSPPLLTPPRWTKSKSRPGSVMPSSFPCFFPIHDLSPPSSPLRSGRNGGRVLTTCPPPSSPHMIPSPPSAVDKAAAGCGQGDSDPPGTLPSRFPQQGGDGGCSGAHAGRGAPGPGRPWGDPGLGGDGGVWPGCVHQVPAGGRGPVVRVRQGEGGGGGGVRNGRGGDVGRGHISHAQKWASCSMLRACNMHAWELWDASCA